MKNIGLFILILIPMITLIAGCNQSNEPIELTFEQLFSNPEKYSGRPITIEGFYFHGFETIVLSEKLQYSGYAPGHLVPDGEMLWIEGGIPKDVFDGMEQQQMMGPTERYGKVRITGVFQYGGQYGHLGGHTAQITPSEIILLPWAPRQE